MSSAMIVFVLWELISLVSMEAESCRLLWCSVVSSTKPNAGFSRMAAVFAGNGEVATLAAKTHLQCVTALPYRKITLPLCVRRIYKLQCLVRKTAGSALTDTRALGSIRYCRRRFDAVSQPPSLPLVPAVEDHEPELEFGPATLVPPYTLVELHIPWMPTSSL